MSTGPAVTNGLASGLRIPGIWKAVLGLAVCTGSIDLLHVYIYWRLGLFRVEPGEAGFLSVWWLSYVLVLAGALYLSRRYPLIPDFRISRCALHVGAAIGLAYLHNGTNAFLLSPTHESVARKLPGAVVLVIMNFPIDFISYWTIVGMTCAFYFYRSVESKRLSEVQLRARTGELQRSLAESRLHALRSQLNPHFLFNTLNVISTLVMKGDATAANRAISRLSMLLRRSVKESALQLTPLENELEFLNCYFEIQKLIFGDRLLVELDIAAGTREAQLPCMLLQPIAENAVVHGIGRQSGEGRIRIETLRDRQSLEIRVTDSGPGFAAPAPEQLGVGLSNTRARMQQHYGNSCELTFGNASAGGASVRIRIPFVSSSQVECEAEG
jgi:hypothetical protein